MGKFGQQPINDAVRAQRLRAPIAFTHHEEGEARLEIRPVGIVERFVDLAGNVLNIQLASWGTPNAAAAAEAKRLQHRRDGFVEHDKCPIRHGVRHSHPAIEKDFAAMPDELERACDKDAPTFVDGADGPESRPPCKHVEWLLATRRQAYEAKMAKLNIAAAKADQLERDKQELLATQLAIAKEELAQLRKKNGKGGAKPGTDE